MEKKRRIINREEVEQVTTASQDEETTIMEVEKDEESTLATVFENCAKVEDYDVESQNANEESTEDVAEETVEAEESTALTEMVDNADEVIDSVLENIVAEIIEDGENTDNIKVEQSEFSYANKEITSANGQYILEMVNTLTPETMLSSGVQFFLREKLTGELLIGSECNLKIDRDKILNSDNHTVMNVIKKYDIGFTQKAIEMAWEKAKELLNTGKMIKVGTSSSLTILEAYRAVVIEVLRRKSKNTEELNQKGKSEYLTENDELWIKTTKLAEILDYVDAGFKPATFCKRLAIAGGINGFDYITPTGHGYATNTNSNVRYYVLKIPKEFYEELVKEGLVKKNAS